MGGHFLCLPIVCEKNRASDAFFLREHCGLTFDVGKKTYVEFVRKFVKE